MAFVEIKGLKKLYGKVHALDGVDLNFELGKQYAIKGASGSGKSTLLYLIGGLDKATEGEVVVAGKNLKDLDDEKLALYRNSFVGFIFQFHFLLPSMNCMDNILLPAKIGNKNTDQVIEVAQELSKTLGVEHCLKKYPFELSGGEQQRINIIRALSLRPKLLLCDEPTGNLDSSNSSLVTNLLKDLAKDFGSTLIVVTHDDNVSQEFESIIHMQDGLTLSAV
ncbi:ABC transporter ATP-binding protein [Halobacteriovorax sp. HLS]|uniref:ABC transporter ATP-binding protein n=1 Tax=Halobacteriovorax sp. HLS TaxID=2234000 RepID=UPI000FD85F5C|nr:ABC transporter ATP-binding protein [Halobacteriovorax sp. HLS]